MSSHFARLAGPHSVYVCRNADREVIYVGCTSDVRRRLVQQRRKPWWPEVSTVQVLDRPNGHDALDIERAFIFHLRPRHNRRLNPECVEQYRAPALGQATVVALLAHLHEDVA